MKSEAIDRQSTLRVSAVLAGVPFCVSGLMVGGALVEKLSLVEGLAAGAIGCAVLTVYAGCTGSLGARLGQSTHQLLRSAFGSVGSKLVCVVMAVCLVGWYSVQTELFGQTIRTMFPGSTFTTKEVASIWGGALMLTSAAFGFRGLAKLSVIAIPLIAILTFGALLTVGSKPGIWEAKPPSAGAFGEAITLVIGSFAIGATVNADITRYSKGTGSAWIASFVGFFLASLYIFVCGAIAKAGTGDFDLITAMSKMGMGAFAFVTLVLSQWTTNDNNIFYAATSMEGVVPNAKRAVIVVVFGVLATAFATAGVTHLFVEFLLWLGVLIPPVGGITIAHHAMDYRRRVVTSAASPFPLPAIMGWVVGVVAGKFLPFGAAAINSVLAAGISYALWRYVDARSYVPSDKGS